LFQNFFKPNYLLSLWERIEMSDRGANPNTLTLALSHFVGEGIKIAAVG